MPSDTAEAWGYALLLTRRVLTTALAGTSEADLHEPTPQGSLADCAAQSCVAEASLIWPEELPPPQLEPPQTPVQILYALVRHRAVTEEILMRASDDTMRQVWWTRAKRLAQDPEQTLSESLRLLAERELQLAQRAVEIRQRIDPQWRAQDGLSERAAQALSAARA